jgi:hypothetical protein
MRMQLLKSLAERGKAHDLDFKSSVDEFELSVQERFELRKLMKVRIHPEAATVEDCMREALIQSANFYAKKAEEIK